MNKLFACLVYVCILHGWIALAYMVATGDISYWWVLVLSSVVGLYSQNKAYK